MEQATVSHKAFVARPVARSAARPGLSIILRKCVARQWRVFSGATPAVLIAGTVTSFW